MSALLLGEAGSDPIEDRLLMPCLKQARRTFRYSSTVKMPPPSLPSERAILAGFYAARRGIIPPLS